MSVVARATTDDRSARGGGAAVRRRYRPTRRASVRRVRQPRLRPAGEREDAPAVGHRAKPVPRARHRRKEAPPAPGGRVRLDRPDRSRRLLAAEHDDLGPRGRRGDAAARVAHRPQALPAAALEPLDGPEVARLRGAAGDGVHGPARGGHGEVLARRRHRWRGPPAPRPQIEHLDGAQGLAAPPGAADGVQPRPHDGRAERAAGRRHVGQPAPAVAARVVAQQRGGLAAQPARVAAHDVEVPPVARRGRMVEREGHRPDAAPAIPTEVVPLHDRRRRTGRRDVPADDVREAAHPRRPDLGAGDRRRAQLLPGRTRGRRGRPVGVGGEGDRGGDRQGAEAPRGERRAGPEGRHPALESHGPSSSVPAGAGIVCVAPPVAWTKRAAASWDFGSR